MPTVIRLPALSDGLFTGGGLGNDPDAASCAGADTPAAPRAEGAASTIAVPPRKASTAASKASTAASESSTASKSSAASEAPAAHGVAAAAAAHAEPPAHAQAAPAAIAHPAGAADHGWE